MSQLPPIRPAAPTSPPDDTHAPALSLIMPLFNEAAGVTPVVQSLQRTLEDAGLAYQLVLVDNGSSDGTGDLIAAMAEADPALECLHLPTNAGYGGGILAGLKQARAPVVGYLWGDEQISHHAVVATYRALLEHRLDLCKARRVVRLDGWQRKVVTRTYHGILPLLFHVGSSDVHGCPKLFTRSALERLEPKATDWFLDAEIMIAARRMKLAVGEIDVVAYPRETGRSKVRWNTLAEFAVNLLRYRIRM